MPTLDTVRVYPGMCLLEGTTMSEGRGTTRPFNMVGAPYLGWEFAVALQQKRAEKAPGSSYLYREAYFTPTFSKWAGNVSAGVDIVLTPRLGETRTSQCLECEEKEEAADPGPLIVEPMLVALEVLTTAREQSANCTAGTHGRGGGFGWIDGGTHVDLLTGGNYTRLAIDRGDSVESILQAHADDLAKSGFADRVRPKYTLPSYSAARCTPARLKR